MIEFKKGMILKDHTDKTGWVIVKGDTGQYGIGVYWTAYLVSEFYPGEERFTVDPTVTRTIDDHDTKSEKYEFFCMSKTVTQWFWDDEATEAYTKKEKEEAYESARKKLTPEEFKLLTGGK